MNVEEERQIYLERYKLHTNFSAYPVRDVVWRNFVYVRVSKLSIKYIKQALLNDLQEECNHDLRSQVQDLEQFSKMSDDWKAVERA